MLGRLKMSVSDTIDAYIELSETVFAPKHRLNLVARLWDTAKVKGSCNSAALEKAIKAIVVKAFGSGHENDVFEEEISPCRRSASEELWVLNSSLLTYLLALFAQFEQIREARQGQCSSEVMPQKGLTIFDLPSGR